jgi:hypothetical protein
MASSMLFSTTAICTVLDILYITHELFPLPSARSCTRTRIYIDVTAQRRRMEADATYSSAAGIFFLLST